MTQIASAHAGLVSAPSLRQDVVSWYLPEALAHAASGALLAAYPKSASHFDARCRQQLFEQIVADPDSPAAARSASRRAAPARRQRRRGTARAGDAVRARSSTAAALAAPAAPATTTARAAAAAPCRG